MLLQSIIFGSLVVFAYSNPQLQPRIVGGSPIGLGVAPYIVSVRNERFGHACSGSIIAPNVILTSSICAQPQAIDLYTVVAGTLNSNEPFEGEQTRKPVSIVNHPDFDMSSPNYDISLIFLNEPFQFNENVTAISLPPADSTYSGTVESHL
jgi:secreted trypsin-like serine protease